MDRLTFRQTLPRWSVPVYTALLSSVIGGLATGPIAAAQFNRFAPYGLLANLLTVPAMGTLIMPGAVVAALLGPIGLAQPGMWLMEAGSRWILAVAHWIAGWEGAAAGVPAPPAVVLPMLVLGAIWGMVWPNRWRLLGIAPMLAALAVWTIADRPSVLVSGDGLLVGVMGPDGRSLSFPRGGSFAAGAWLQRDGDLALQEDAATRPPFRDEDGMRLAAIDGLTLVHLKGKGMEGRMAAACALAPVVVLDRPAEGVVPEGCLVLDEVALRHTGAVGLEMRDGKVRIIPTLDARRAWDVQ